MECEIIGIDLAKGNDKTAYVKRNKETGEIKNIEIVENYKTK